MREKTAVASSHTGGSFSLLEAAAICGERGTAAAAVAEKDLLSHSFLLSLFRMLLLLLLPLDSLLLCLLAIPHSDDGRGNFLLMTLLFR